MLYRPLTPLEYGERVVSEPDRCILRDFSDHRGLLESGNSTHRHLKFPRHVTIMAGNVDGPCAASPVVKSAWASKIPERLERLFRGHRLAAVGVR